MAKDNKNKKQDKIDPVEIEQEYGLSYAMFKAFPGLMNLLHQAVANHWSPAKFQVEFRNTDFYKKHSATWRQMTALKYTDPTSYQQRLDDSLSAVRDLAGQYGVDLTHHGMHRLAERALLLGWDAGQIRDVLANHVVPTGHGHYEGQLAPIEESLRNTALRNGVQLEKEQLQHWMRAIVRGNASQDQYQNHIREIAAQTYSAYGEQIKGGVDLADIAAPYIQTMASTLELNPASIDLYDKTIRRALSHKNDKGEPVPLSISDFEDHLRADRRWQYTDQAKTQMTDYAVKLGQLFGVL